MTGLHTERSTLAAWIRATRKSSSMTSVRIMLRAPDCRLRGWPQPPAFGWPRPTASGPRNALPGRPGIARIVEEAYAAGWVLAVASTSAEPSVRAVLEHVVGTARTRDFTVLAGDIVPRKKPAPDIYFLALERLGLAADRVVAIEDSRPGLAAAHDAGIACVVTVNGYTAHEDFTDHKRLLAGVRLVDRVAALEEPAQDQEIGTLVVHQQDAALARAVDPVLGDERSQSFIQHALQCPCFDVAQANSRWSFFEHPKDRTVTGHLNRPQVKSRDCGASFLRQRSPGGA